PRTVPLRDLHGVELHPALSRRKRTRTRRLRRQVDVEHRSIEDLLCFALTGERERHRSSTVLVVEFPIRAYRLISVRDSEAHPGATSVQRLLRRISNYSSGGGTIASTPRKKAEY